MSRRLMLYCLAGFAVVLPACAVAQDKVDIVGNYTVAGKNPEGGQYTGKATIAKKGDTYQVRWDAGGQYEGIGILKGDQFSVSWVSGNTSGIIVYKVEKDKLVGEWSMLGGNGKIQTETLTKVK